MNKMIKPLFVILMIFFVFLSSCGQVDNHKEIKYDDTFYLVKDSTSSEKGFYYVENNMDSDPWKNTIYYVDTNSHKKIILCNKLNCKHESKDCDGLFLDDSFIKIHHVGSQLYLFETNLNHNSNLTIYQCDEDGSNRRKIHTFKDIQQIPDTILFYNNYIFVGAQSKVYSDDNTYSFGSDPCIYMYDLKTQKETMLLDGTRTPNLYTYILGGYQDDLFFLQYNDSEENDELALYRFNYLNQEQKYLYSLSFKNMQFINDKIFYEYNDQNHSVYQINIDTMKKEEIVKLEPYQVDADDQYYVNFHDEFIELSHWVVENQSIVETKTNIYDLQYQKYLFDDYQDIYVKLKKDNYYLLENDNQIMIYDCKQDRFYDIKDIN